MKTTIGTCSLCGGAVTVPTTWMGIIPPTAKCEGCGAERADHGPVIDMKPVPRTRYFTTTGTNMTWPPEVK